ncbi:hypothetical protein DQ393_13065 [Rhizobium tropici]|uniref:Uncharacterized protein n=1 Tax=Rhizobium tropici TaxID=398 RepID=A0A329YCY5_RHITR|nr:hypothetical protein DQ393_13065 [Rhizobium tropici]
MRHVQGVSPSKRDDHWFEFHQEHTTGVLSKNYGLEPFRWTLPAVDAFALLCFHGNGRWAAAFDDAMILIAVVLIDE